MIISTVVSLIVVVVAVVNNNNIYTGICMYVYTHNIPFIFKPLHLLNHRVPIESAQQAFRYERNDNRKRQRVPNITYSTKNM